MRRIYNVRVILCNAELSVVLVVADEHAECVKSMDVKVLWKIAIACVRCYIMFKYTKLQFDPTISGFSSQEVLDTKYHDGIQMGGKI